MEQQNKNKEFIIEYFNAFSGVPKTRELMEKYISDQALIGHIEFFEIAFPGYEIYADEMTAEGNRVIVKSHLQGTHSGYMGEMPPTYKEVNFPFVIGYEIENNMIVSHWMLADQMALMGQLGILPAAQAAH
jgi:hypothetical protein